MVRMVGLRIWTALAIALAAGVMLVVSGSPATATQGQAVIAGQTNTEQNATVVNNTLFTVSNCSGQSEDGLVACGATAVTGLGEIGVRGNGSIYGVEGQGDSFGAVGIGGSAGLYGSSTSGDGVQGVTHNAGSSAVFGNNTAGGKGVFGASATGNGVEGGTGGSTGSGVYGSNSSTGYGVDGQSASGIGVGATSANGTALQVSGRAKFSTAGIAVVASGNKSVTVTLAGVKASDFVLATVQGSGSFYVKNASTGNGQFTVFINKAPTAPATVKVAYFVISAS